MQGKTGRERGPDVCRQLLFQGGNPHELLGMWEGNHCPVQADPGSPGILPGMFPAATHNGSLGLIAGNRAAPNTRLSEGAAIAVTKCGTQGGGE